MGLHDKLNLPSDRSDIIRRAFGASDGQIAAGGFNEAVNPRDTEFLCNEIIETLLHSRNEKFVSPELREVARTWKTRFDTITKL